MLDPTVVFEDSEYWHGRLISHGGAATTPFAMRDIRRTIAEYSDPPGWDGECVCVVQLSDGRYVSWETFWGPTGNGFSEDAYGGDADIHFAKTLDDIINFGLTDVGRSRLGLRATNS